MSLFVLEFGILRMEKKEKEEDVDMEFPKEEAEENEGNSTWLILLCGCLKIKKMVVKMHLSAESRW